MPTRRFRPLSLTLTLWLLLAFSLAPASVRGMEATPPPPTPQTPAHPPITPPRLASGAESESVEGASLNLPPLKAVLLVGPIDGDTGSWTTSEKQNMDLAANELAANGVTVYKFYTPNNDWEQIKAAANGAQFLFYRGHGVYWSAMPYPTVGGFALNGKFASSDNIRNDLHLAPNAIVMLYACFSAGSAGNDTISVTSAEAQRRVAMYSAPFLDLGVAGYYADWFGDAFQMYVRYLFQGKTLGQAYESYFDFNPATVERYTYPGRPALAFWLDKDYWYDPKPQYNNAFVGQPSKTLTDLFPNAAMQISPRQVARLTTASDPPAVVNLRVDGVGATSFNWTATVSPTMPAWLNVTPLSGAAGQTLTTTLTAPAALGVYTATIHIVADNTQIGAWDQTVTVTLQVADQVWTAYLPMTAR